MSRTIRDYESNGKLWDIIKKAHSFNVYVTVGDLKWNPVSRHPKSGQRVIVSRNGWNVEAGYYADGMFFHEGWDWANEFSEFDGWMAMPLPMNWKEETKCVG